MPTINGKACVANGRNLYTDTKNFENLASWKGSDSWTKTTDTYNGLAVMQTTQDWNGLSQYTKVKKGDILTYSVYARYTSGTGSSMISWTIGSQSEGSYSPGGVTPYWNTVAITDSWQRVSGTVVATIDGYLRPRLERTNDNTNILQIAGIKVETGTVATPLTPAPVDKVFSDGKQVYGRNLLTNSRGKFQPNLSKIDNHIVYHDSVVYMEQGQQYTVHADASSGLVWSGTHSPGATNNNAVLWLVNKVNVASIVSDANTCTGTTFTWNYPSGTYYLRANTYNPDNSGYVENVKIERGTIATPYSPAPEEVM